MHISTTATILLLGATSTDNVLHSVPKELSAIKQLFDDKNSPALSFQVEYEPYFTQDGLKKLLDRLANKVAILHFAGHSNAEGLQTDDKLVYSQHIAEIIKNWSIQPTLIFLNGCQNQQQVQFFLDAGVANIIATHKPINDHQASQFALEFYTSLFSSNADLPLQVAFKQAGEKVFLDKQGQSRSLMIESLDQTDSDNWDWGLFEKYPNAEQQWTLQRLLSEDRPQLDNNGKLLNPYKGLQAFKEEDQLWFFGRDVLAKELTKTIQDSQFFTLLGASGSGKSSVINAAVIPQLRHDSNSLILKTNPANAPFSELAYVFCKLLYPDSLIQINKQKDLTQQLQEQQILIPDLVKPLLQTTGKSKLYLCIDQFEELFTQSPQPIIQNFLHQLIQLINTQKDCCLILIMRADFLASALANAEFAELMDKHPHKLLAPMAKAELREAIEKPANKQRIHLEASLLEALLDDIENQSGYLPLLQYTLNLLWDKCQGTTIKLADYTALGGLKKVLETRANEIYQGFSKQQQDHCKQIFLRLIQPGEGTEDTRRRASLDEFDQQNEALQTTLKILADARLITTLKDSESKQAYAEISHEALIKYWPQLREWIAENRDQLRSQHQISAGAKEWELHDNDRAWLLSGSRLIIAEEWLKNNEARATALENTFIQKGIEERDRQIKAKEQRRKRNRNVLVGFLAMITMIALFAFAQWQGANKARYIADKKTVIAIQEADNAKKAKDEALIAKRKTDKKILEANYYLAKTYEGKALKALSKGDNKAQENDRNKSLFGYPQPAWLTEYKKAWLYALEAEKLQLPKDKITLKQTSLIKLTNISAKAISPERKITPIFEEKSNINAITYSPDGKVLASASNDKTIKLWDVNSGQLKKTLKGHAQNVLSVIYSPNGKILASYSSDNMVKLWDAHSGHLEKTINIHKLNANKLGLGRNSSILNRKMAYSPNGKILTFALSDKTIQLWDSNSGQIKQILKGHSSDVNAVSYSPNGKMLASASSDKTVRLWDVGNGQLKQTLYGHIDGVLAVIYSPNGKVLASASSDKTVRLWDANSGQLKQTLRGHDGTVQSLVYSPDGKVLASASKDLTVRLWDTKNGQLKQILRGHSSEVNSVIYSPNSKVLTTASYKQMMKFWDINIYKHFEERFLTSRSHKNRLNVKKNTNTIRSATNPFSRKIPILPASIYDKNRLRILKRVDMEHPKRKEDKLKMPFIALKQTLKGHRNLIYLAVYSPDGKILVSTSVDKTMKFWDADSGQLKQTFSNINLGTIWSIAHSPDGKMLALAPRDKVVQLWDISNEQIKQTLKGHTDVVRSVIYSPNGKVLASSSDDKTVRLWDVNTGQLKYTLEGHTGRVLSIAYSPDGKVLASASSDKTVRLWDVGSGQVKQILKGHTDTVLSVAYSPNGKVLASASYDKTVRLWDTDSGQVKQILKGHTDTVSSVTYSPNGKILASASYDKTVRLWKANSGQLKQILAGHTAYVMSVTYSPDGKVLTSASKDKMIRLWNHNQFTTLKLFYDFEPKQVSDALKFLWEMELDKEKLEFVRQLRTPTLYLKKGYYYEDVKFYPLLNAPRKNKSKMDQLVRFLEARCAYKDKKRRNSCENKHTNIENTNTLD